MDTGPRLDSSMTPAGVRCPLRPSPSLRRPFPAWELLPLHRAGCQTTSTDQLASPPEALIFPILRRAPLAMALLVAVRAQVRTSTLLRCVLAAEVATTATTTTTTTFGALGLRAPRVVAVLLLPALLLPPPFSPLPTRLAGKPAPADLPLSLGERRTVVLESLG